MIDIEKELLEVQIKHIEKEINLLDEMYFGDSEYYKDFYKIKVKYDNQLVEKECTLEEKLDFYKQYYIECLTLFFENREELGIDLNDKEPDYVDYTSDGNEDVIPF